MTNPDVRIKIVFAADGYTELEVSTPIHSSAGFRMWAALASLRINPMSAYLVRSQARLIANVKLTEYDGSPIGQNRAGEVLNLLKERLSNTGAPSSGVRLRTAADIHFGGCAWRSSDGTEQDERRSA